MSEAMERIANERAIMEVVEAYRAAHLSDGQIKSYLMQHFDLKEKDVEGYLAPVPAA